MKNLFSITLTVHTNAETHLYRYVTEKKFNCTEKSSVVQSQNHTLNNQFYTVVKSLKRMENKLVFPIAKQCTE